MICGNCDHNITISGNAMCSLCQTYKKIDKQNARAANLAKLLYYCRCCGYNASTQTVLNKHMSTRKHDKNAQEYYAHELAAIARKDAAEYFS